jgi:predicted CXXCH cytochrome family protein
LHRLLPFLIVVTFTGPLAAQGELRYFFAESKKRVIHAPWGLIKGIYTTSNAATMLALYRTERTVEIDVSTADLKQAFPRQIRDLFRDGLHLESLTVVTTAQQSQLDTLAFVYTIEDQINLVNFWDLVDFRQILARIYRQDVISARVIIQGWNSVLRHLNTQGSIQHLNMFSFNLPLSPGNNEITLRVMDGSGDLVKSDTLNFYYLLDTIDESPPAHSTKASFHENNRSDFCSRCHAELEEEDCIRCHTGLVNHNYLHSPTEEGDCTSCHDTEGSPKMIVMEDMRYNSGPCLECHSDLDDELLEAESVHPPVEEGCLMCHDPHGSANPFLLAKKVIDTCTYCHEDKTEGNHPVRGHPLEGPKDPLRGGYQFSCASCHNPHASSEDVMLREPWMVMCSECHSK